MRLIITVLGAFVLAVAGLPATAVLAQPGRECFQETNQCIEGRFLEYWRENGGLAVFGFPIGPPRMEINRDTQQSFLTQWFERNRFELHPENRRPYDVLLGRLGDDRLLQRGVNWQSEPRAPGSQPDCLWFEETRHNVCDQASGLGFRTYWLTHGLLDPELSSFQRSLALFGLPLTEPRMETNPDGDTVLTQWFERARLEWHPNNRDEFKVLLGRLGVEVRRNQVAVLRSSAANAAGLQAVVDSYRAELGEPSHVAGPPASAGRREINWDGVPANRSSPNALPGDFFNVNSPRGVVFSTPGSGFQVSANSADGPTAFGNINPAYSSTFSTFSAQKLFTAVGSNITDVVFVVPGSTTRATVRGFGAVFSDVDLPTSTHIEFFDAGGRSLGQLAVPAGPSGGLSFLGVALSEDAPVGIARVRITSGNAALGASVNDGGVVDLVVMDDFIYGEPRANNTNGSNGSNGRRG